jgi:PAS domain S-box-containing protein
MAFGSSSPSDVDVLPALVGSLPLFLWTADSNGHLIGLNRNATNYLGGILSPRRVIDRQDLPRAIHAWRRSTREGSPFSQDLRLCRASDQSWRWHACHARPADLGGYRGWVGVAIDIDDRKRAESQVRQREKLFLTAIHDASIGMAFFDLEGRFIEANPACCLLNGCSEDELRKKTFLSSTHPEDRAEASARINQLLAGRVSSFTFERRGMRHDGSTRWIRSTVSLARDEGGKPWRILAFNEDVTDRHEALVSLRDRNNQLAGLARAAMEMNAAPDVDRVLSVVSRSAQELLGADRATATQTGGPGAEAQRISEWPQRDEESLKEATAPDALRDEVRRTNRARRTSGGMAAPLKGRRGENFGSIELSRREAAEFTDSDEAVLVQLAETASLAVEKADLYASLLATNEALAMSERQFRLLAEAMPQLVWTANRLGEVDYLNLHWYEYTGSTFDLSGGAGWMEHIHPDDREQLRREWESSVQTGEPLDVECRVRRGIDGAYRWFLTRALALQSSDGQVLRWFGTCTDIDGQKTTETELRRANDDLSQFAYAASHDLQEPLRMVIAYTQLMEMKLGEHLDADTRAFCEQVVEGARRMNLLIRDLLAYTDLGRATEGRDETHETEASLADALANLKEGLQVSDARVTWEPLPRVRGRRAHFVQLFQNLVSNAVKYRRDDTRLRIHISATAAGADWLFRVADNGIGIAPEYHKKIFGLFKRLHGKQVSGTGIGLAICAKVVSNYGGKIWVESEPGRGATFCFTVGRL